MDDALWKRLQLLVSVLSLLLVLALAGAGAVWWRVRASLPALDGRQTLAGLDVPVTVARDALGVPTITGATRLDVARATGYVHAQDRFFQMDLMRRNSAGELAALFGEAALPVDRANRLHAFRANAARVLAQLPPAHRALLDAYAAGVNAGLAALPRVPWEYAVLRAAPEPWLPEDCLLVVYAMWLDLQETDGRTELSRLALRETLGAEGVAFLAPEGDSWDSALDGSGFAAPPLPSFRFGARRADPAVPAAVVESEPKPGSNSLALAAPHTAAGVPIVANDMHLDHRVPTTWHRAVLAWIDPDGTDRRLVGVTLPGMPLLVAGSNGRIAWGYTNAYVDTADVVLVETDATSGSFYRTPEGQREIEERTETFAVRDAAPATHRQRRTAWGPVFGTGADGHFLVLRWTAHDPSALNLDITGLETATTVEEAVAIAHRAGMPNQNLVVADTQGGLAWTVTGRIPRRVGYDGRYPVSWGYGDRHWDGWLSPEEIPTVINPPDGLLWTANQRLVGGEAYARTGDGGYDDGARGRQIRDGLRALASSEHKAAPADLLAIQLDDRALFLERWQRLFVTVLDDAAVAAKRSRGELRAAVQAWNSRASPDSAAYRLVRAWRQRVAGHALEPFWVQARRQLPAFDAGSFHTEDALWHLANERPAGLLNPEFPSWEALLLRAADEVLAESDRDGLPPDRWVWGGHNTLRMQHPFSRLLPAWLAPLLDLPAQPLPGDTRMPRVQTPSHGASERLVVAPGREDEGLFHMPGGQSGNPCSPFYRAGHDAWARGEPTPLLPGPVQHTLVLNPK